jgi:Uncharacterized protein conserved in bacteria (DUF2188)
MTTNVQVYREPDGNRWGVRVVGEEETQPRLFDSRDEAIREGRRLADERQADLLVHDETGETEVKDRPADDGSTSR